MTTLAELRKHLTTASFQPPQYLCQQPINLYKSAALEGLVTQADRDRCLMITTLPMVDGSAIAALPVRLCEDDYPGWIAIADLAHLTLAPAPYQAPVLTRPEIEARLPEVIAFTQRAMAIPNQYLWGGTVSPDYDCSGLMQAAFASVGIRLPRDSYQQEAFTQPIALEELQPGDLIFFGTPERTTHVALHLEAGRYIHSSGKEQGRNGIGIDALYDLTDPVSHAYFQQLRRAGRVMASYHPQHVYQPN